MSFFLERETDGAKTGQSHLQLGKKGQRQQVTMVFLLYEVFFLRILLYLCFLKYIVNIPIQTLIFLP